MAQNVRINGIASTAAGKKIRLFTYSDYVSELPKKLDEAIIDASGKFELKTSTGETFFAWIQIDRFKTEVFLEPNSEYNITILPFDFNTDEKVGPFLDKRRLQLEFVNPDSTDINQLLYKFNAIYNDFVINNFNDIYKKRDKKKLDSLNTKLTAAFEEVNNPFFHNYMLYKIAEIEQGANLAGRKKIFDKYVDEKPILYINIAYMNFFSQFYEKFFFNGNHKIRLNDYKRFVDETKDYKKVLDSLGQDVYVRNEVIRELVFLQGMKDLYYLKKYNEPNIIEILTKFSLKTKFKEHKLIAQNLIKSFNFLNEGKAAPDFKLQNVKGNTFTLNSFKGKYTYLCFFTTWCGGCMPEVEGMRALNAKYGKDVNFVCISLDKELMTLDLFLQKKKYDWFFLHYGGNIELIENYAISTYPVFMLLDKAGNIVKNPALKPSEDIESSFKELFAPEAINQEK